jgi:hypothetical protein
LEQKYETMGEAFLRGMKGLRAISIDDHIGLEENLILTNFRQPRGGSKRRLRRIAGSGPIDRSNVLLLCGETRFLLKYRRKPGEESWACWFLHGLAESEQLATLHSWYFTTSGDSMDIFTLPRS